MIGYLKGKIIFVEGKTLIIDVNSVGYRIDVPDDSFLVGQEAEFFVYTHLRENEIKLFGFKTSQDLNVFQRLIEVDGVGPKAGINLISHLGASTIVMAIKMEDPMTLKVPGIGLKTAQKIILELKSKFDSIVMENSDQNQSNKAIVDELRDTLISLGFNNNEINQVIHKLNIDKDSNINALLKQSLQMLSK